VLIAFWREFNRFAVNRASAPSVGCDPEIMFWYAFPGFQLGLVLGFSLISARRSLSQTLRLLLLTVWLENVVNLTIIILLVGNGLLF
jgi:hypothetical protein